MFNFRFIALIGFYLLAFSAQQSKALQCYLGNVDWTECKSSAMATFATTYKNNVPYISYTRNIVMAACNQCSIKLDASPGFINIERQKVVEAINTLSLPSNCQASRAGWIIIQDSFNSMKNVNLTITSGASVVCKI
ncbi:hypothetical protein CROQUDRAFT_658066, partial [Cronartium quercuum f. sp. fusiforme G11]